MTTALLLAAGGLLNFVLAGAVVVVWRRAGRRGSELAAVRREFEALQAAAEAGCRREAFYRAILEDIPEMICRWSPDGRISYVNDAYCRHFGLSREELLGKPGLAFFHATGGGRGGAPDAALYRRQPVVVVEFPIRWPDGSVRWQRWIDRALFDEQGEIREFQSIGTDITDCKQAEEERARLSEENRRLARMALVVQEQERTNLARELHDELGQSLVAIRAEAECIRRINRDTDATIAASTAAIDRVAGRFYTVVRGMTHRLRPELLDDLGLAAALKELVAEWRRRHVQTEITLALDDLPPLDRDVELAVWRIAQEALTNISRHAGATRVEVAAKASMRSRRDFLELRVRDNGRGMDVHAGDPGFGLLGMRERASIFGGEFEVISVPGNGTTIRALLPSAVREGEGVTHG